VATDLLPGDADWDAWLAAAGMRKTRLVDQEFFFLQAELGHEA
jgi:hypothetical protein